MKIIIDKDRKLIRIEAEDFMLRLNGKSNAEYKAILKLVGIDLTIEPGAESVEVAAVDIAPFPET